METIRKGEKPSEKIHRGACDNCNSLIDAKRSELSEISKGGMLGTLYLCASCPECGADMNFNTEDQESKERRERNSNSSAWGDK